MTGQYVSKSTAFVAVILLLCALPASAQQINGRFSTAVYGWEQFDTAGVSKSLVLGLQNIQVDVTQSGFTLSTSVYGNTELSEPFGSGGEFRVRNAFAGYRSDDRKFEMKLGRVPVFAGVGLGTVDGAMFKVRAMESKLAVSAYGGSNVPGSLVYDHNRDIDKNFLLGAQVTGELAKGTRFGVSYVNRMIERPDYEAVRADSLYNPVAVMVSPGSRATQLVGADVSHAGGLLDVYGRYDYDLNLERTRRAEVNARAGVIGDFTLLANFIYREPDVPYNSWFKFFPLSPIREYEGGLEYAFKPTLRASARFAYVGYEGDLSRRLTAGVAAGNFSASYSGSNGYAGELSSFYLQGAQPFLDGLLTPTLGISYSTYKLSSASPEETMFSGALGAIIRPDAPVTFELQGQLVDNRYMKNDMRGFLKISYWFNHNLGVL
jgi:hypothetical protein